MIKTNCEKCGKSYTLSVRYSGKNVNCKQCRHVIKVPVAPKLPDGYIPDITYEDDGITPNFDALFQALAQEEQRAR